MPAIELLNGRLDCAEQDLDEPLADALLVQEDEEDTRPVVVLEIVVKKPKSKSPSCDHLDSGERCREQAHVRLNYGLLENAHLQVCDDHLKTAPDQHKGRTRIRNGVACGSALPYRFLCERHTKVGFVSNYEPCDRLESGRRCGSLAAFWFQVNDSDPGDRAIRCEEHATILNDEPYSLILQRTFDPHDTYWFYRSDHLSSKQQDRLVHPRRRTYRPPMIQHVGPKDPATYTNRVFAKSCEDMSDVPDGTVKLVLTSSPYYDKMQYSSAKEIGLEPTAEQFMHRIVRRVMREAWRVLADDGVMALNIADTFASASACNRDEPIRMGMGSPDKSERRYRISRFHKDKDLMCVPWTIGNLAKEDGWFLRSSIIWHKEDAKREPFLDRCQIRHEYLLIFAKQRHYCFDRSKMPQWAQGTVWNIRTEHLDGQHPAVMPKALAAAVIAACTQAGDLVADPFLGSGTVAVAAIEAACNWVGYELNPAYHPLIARRVADAHMRMTMLGQSPLLGQPFPGITPRIDTTDQLALF